MIDFTHVAYLDPSTGSLFIQSVIGVVAGVGVFGRRAVANSARKFKTMITGDRSKEDEV